MKSKHRPGPWEVLNFGDGPSVYSVTGEPVALAIGYKPMQLPNAKLIAAAPQLRDALEKVTERLREYEPEFASVGWEALAKAEVEPPSWMKEAK